MTKEKTSFKDSKTVAIPFNTQIDDIDNYEANDYKDWQIILYNVSDEKVKGIVPEGKWSLGETNVEYIADMNCFLIFNETVMVP